MHEKASSGCFQRKMPQKIGGGNMAKKTIPVSEHEEIVRGYEQTIKDLKEEIRMREKAVREIARAAEEAKNSRYEKDMISTVNRNADRQKRLRAATEASKRERIQREKKRMRDISVYSFSAFLCAVLMILDAYCETRFCMDGLWLQRAIITAALIYLGFCITRLVDAIRRQ